MKYFKSAIALSAAALAHTAAAWDITFYSDDSCGNEASYTSTNYHGTPFDGIDKMDICIMPGMYGTVLNNCEWRVTTNGVTTTGPCTAPNNPQPKSFWLTPGTKCFLSHYQGCGNDKIFGKSHVEMCISTLEIHKVYEDDPDVWFWCEAEDN